MRFAREHLFGIILGVVLMEVYRRSQQSKGGGQ